MGGTVDYLRRRRKRHAILMRLTGHQFRQNISKIKRLSAHKRTYNRLGATMTAVDIIGWVLLAVVFAATLSLSNDRVG